MTNVLLRGRIVVTPAALTLGIAAACWAVAVGQMRGMDMGVATELGSFGFFIVVWVLMMAAMMLPGAVPAVLRCVHGARQARAVPMFVASYLAVWAFVGVAVFSLYRPHGTTAAGVVAIAVGVYELTPFKRHCRERCRARVDSGLEFGLYCVGSSSGLMLIMVALSAMSIAWMAIVTVLVAGQKLLPRRAILDVPLALVIIALGVLIIVAPATIPDLMPAM